MNVDFHEARERYAGRSLDDMLCDVDSQHLPALTACRLLGVTALDLKRLLSEFVRRREHRKATWDACTVAALWRSGHLRLVHPDAFFAARLDGLAESVGKEEVFRQWIETLPAPEIR